MSKIIVRDTHRVSSSHVSFGNIWVVLKPKVGSGFDFGEKMLNSEHSIFYALTICEGK